MDAEPSARSRKASLESIVQRYVSDLKAAHLGVVLDPNLSEEDRARQLRRLCGDRDDMRKARRVLFRYLPSELLNTRPRVQAATGMAWFVAQFVGGVRAGDDARIRGEARRAIELDREKARAGVVAAIALLKNCGSRLDRWTLSNYAYSTAINVLGPRHSITCDDGLLSDQIGALLADVAAIFDQPFSVSDPPQGNFPAPESELDTVVSVFLEGILPLRAQARLLVELRAALDLAPTTAEQAYQRIRRARAHRRKS